MDHFGILGIGVERNEVFYVTKTQTTGKISFTFFCIYHGMLRFYFKMTARKVLTGEIADLLQHTEAIQSENMTFRYMLGVDGKYKH